MEMSEGAATAVHAHHGHRAASAPSLGVLGSQASLLNTKSGDGTGTGRGGETLTHAHLLITIARMIGNHPNFRIFTMGGFCFAMRTHTGVRAMKPMQTTGVRNRLSGKRKKKKKGDACRARAQHGVGGSGLGCRDGMWAGN